jgi:hypothetical protein
MDMEADEVLIKLDRVSERRIQDAIEAGEFDNLEGAGKPLQMDDNPFVPEDMRVAYKVLKNSGFAPDWMVLSQEIEEDIQRLRHRADRHFAYLRRSLHEISGDPYAIKRLRAEVSRLKNEHIRAARQHSLAIEEINRKITTFNQTVPIGSLLKVPLSLSVEMEAYEDRVPAYLSYA